MYKSNILLFVTILTTSIQSALTQEAEDAIFWSNKQNLKTRSIENLLNEATPKNPAVVLLLTNPFQLATFSELAAVYSPDSGESKIPAISRSLMDSKEYSANRISEDFVSVLQKLDEKNMVVQYENDKDIDLIDTARVILVIAESLQGLEKKWGQIFNKMLHRSYQAVLTGLPEYQSRYKRANPSDVDSFAAKSNVTGIYIHNKTCALYLGSVWIMAKQNVSKTKTNWIPVVIDPKNATVKNTHCSCLNDTASFSLNFAGNFQGSITDETSRRQESVTVSRLNLDLNFLLEPNGYWHLSGVHLSQLSLTCTFSSGACLKNITRADNVTGHMSSVYSVPDFAYACYETQVKLPREIQNNLMLHFQRIQVQPFNVKNGTFTDNVDDCVGFFTIGIWMGIIVGGLMLLIFLFGISMVTNLKTMDRFDDAKGKMLQINAKDY